MTDHIAPQPAQPFKTFREFYPFYLGEHRNAVCRRLHVVGTSLGSVILISALVTQAWQLLWLVPIVSYGFAWVGHFFFEHNKPASFKQPFYSLAGDLVMLKDVLIGRVPW